MIRHAYADYLMVMGRNEESLEQVKIGYRHDPVSPMGVVPLFGHLLIAGRYDESIEECRKILELDPNFPVARHFLAEGLWLKDMYDDALEEFKADWAGDEERLAALERGYAASGPRGAMLAAADEMAGRAREGRVSAFTVAGYYAKAGEADSTLRWLEEAYEARDISILHIVALPHYDFLRSDQRFHDLLQRIGLPEGAK
jgi:tetratricopeptide (TPR) repeat protein